MVYIRPRLRIYSHHTPHKGPKLGRNVRAPGGCRVSELVIGDAIQDSQGSSLLEGVVEETERVEYTAQGPYICGVKVCVCVFVCCVRAEKGL